MQDHLEGDLRELVSFLVHGWTNLSRGGWAAARPALVYVLFRGFISLELGLFLSLDLALMLVVGLEEREPDDCRKGKVHDRKDDIAPVAAGHEEGEEIMTGSWFASKFTKWQPAQPIVIHS